MTVTLDFHLALEMLVLLVSCYSALANQRTKIEILSLKLWITENFHAKKDAKLIDACEKVD